jgi:hypothetical protein
LLTDRKSRQLPRREYGSGLRERLVPERPYRH